ncbi:hypothetical protein VNO80_00707 [Phaseolus coccineus]|uniref:AAA+ ATPase domain-containing protein n=1 Tax=Phaseolus coccineus TaxID=3886 RepID=A0AAN9P463_PHACN
MEKGVVDGDFESEQNALELDNSVKDLGFEKERIDHQCDEAAKNLNNIEGKVTEWVKKVSEIETIVEKFENDDGHQRALSLNCYVFPYFLNRHRLGRRAKKMEEDVKKLLHEFPKYDEVSYRQDVTSNEATLSNSGFIEFGSTKSIMEAVMTQLEDSTVRMIGLYGPGGVGKSILIKEIARKAKYKKLFDVVVIVEITANPNLQKVQEEIAYVLGLRLEGEGISLDDDDDDDLSNDNKDPNHQENKVLKKEKILNVHKGRKILLTSRDKNVLCVQMDVKSTFCVKELDDKDALMLFQKLAGIHNEMSASKQEIVKKYCAGLPMAIVTVARALRRKSESVWEATLEKLKKEELVGVQTSMDISVKMSYDHLENEEIKSIFLLCAQMGHQPLIMDLVKYCFGLGILEGVSSLWEARDRIKTSIQKLRDSGLLLDDSSINNFNRHDMVRDSALSIAYKDHNFFTLRNGKLDNWPGLEKCTSISICNSDIIDGLPQVINCPQLKLFQIDTTDPSLEIPESFFRRMKNLRVLILIGFRLSSLPYSIQCLLELRMLCLERCTLDCNLSILGKLKKLRILSFSGSQLKNLPIELQSLDKLRLLDISDCSALKIIPPYLISSLACLEELYIRETLMKMLVESEIDKGQNLFLSELKNLHQLKVVDLSVPCVSVFPNHLFFEKLNDYKILIGDIELFSVGEFRMPDKYETFRVLALQLKDDTDIHSQESIKLLFKTIQKSLCLYNLGNLEMICYGPITVMSFAKLKTIKVKMCHRLRNLYSFYKVKFPTSAQTCEISECNFYMDKFLANLETIEVSECGSLKEILQISTHYGKVEFLKLHSLTLRLLPSFTYFYAKVEDSCWSHLIEPQTTNKSLIEITSEEDEQSEKTTPLFGDLVEIPNLESLNLSSLNIHKIWSDQHSSSFIFQNLIKLVVKDCDKLTYLCSLSMASSLKKLKSLVLSECPFMEKIFKTGGNSANKVCIDVCVFPKLEEIHLSKMDSLTDMWETKVSIDSFSSLISVNIEECNKLDKIFPSHMEGWIECLDNLKVSRCNSVKVIFEINDSQEIDAFGGIDTNLEVILLEHLPKLKQLWSTDPDGILNLKKLRTINVDSCRELRNLFPASIAKDVPKLEFMSASFCDKMEKIVASQHESETNKDPLVFPELTYVRLYGLENFKHFYKRHHIKCPKLKKLSVDYYVQLKTFLKETCKTTDEEVFPNLEYMEIKFKEAQKLLPEYQMHRLKELRLISVKSVVDLLYHFPYTMLNLQKLELFSWSQELEATANIPQQKRLGMVLQLKELVLLYSNIKDLELGRVLAGVPALRRLELLSLEGCDGLTNLAPSSVSFTYMTSLKLKRCNGLRNLMASSTAKTMVQLQTMKVIDCSQLEQIVSEEGKVMKIVFCKLITVELVRLKKMRSFCSYKECEFEFPSLEILIVRECRMMEKFSERESIAPKLKNVFGVEGDEKAKWHWEGDLNATIQKVFNHKLTFAFSEYLSLEDYTEYVQQLWHGPRWVHQNTFGYLKTLSAFGCDTLEHVIPSHLLSCNNLEELHVNSCKAAQFIFNINDEDRLTKASGIFRLKTLSLRYLPKLEHVWDKDPQGIIGLQVLKEMTVTYCESLKSLFPASVAKDLTRLQVLEVKECEELAEIFRKDEKGEEGERTTQDFAFPPLTSFTLERLPRLKYSIHCSKQELILTTLPLIRMVIQVQNLDNIALSNYTFFDRVVSCYSIKTIFDVKCTIKGALITFPLKRMVLWKLPNLENVWNENPRGILNMHHLQEVHVWKCKVLTSVFPTSVAKDLVEIENLEVKDCDGLMTIVGEDDTDPSGTKQELPCPCVGSLNLQGLPKFKYFNYSLKSDIYTHLDSHTKDQLRTEKCLLLFENGVEMILRGEFQRNLLDNLKALTLYFGWDLYGYEILKQVPNIEKLIVRDGSFKEMFGCKSPINVDYSALLLQLKVLHLESLKDMVSIGLENSWIETIVKNIETFEVISCSSLKSLVTCRVSFSNLTYLKVEWGSSLSYLLTSSTARSLAQLQRMEILRCHSIEEIMSKEEGEESDEDEIIFPKLINLNFYRLLKLKRFYRGRLSFPSLKELSITDSDEMITLCAASNKREQSLELRNRADLQEIWRVSVQIPDLCFSYLKTLIVEGCHFSSHALPFTLLPLLPLLETLEVRNCHSVKTIFDVQCPQNTLTIPLKTLVLWKLPNLESVWNEDPSEIVTEVSPADPKEKSPKLTFPTLTSLTLWDLPKFKHNTIHSIHHATTKLKELHLESLGELVSIGLENSWTDTFSLNNFCFNNLAILTVDECQFLSDAMLPFHFLPFLSKLDTLKVQNCDYVKTIFDVKCTTKDTFTFPLKKSVLSKLPNLENVWNEDPRGILCIQYLKEVHVKECKGLSSVFPTSVAKDLMKLEDLVVEMTTIAEECVEGEEIIFERLQVLHLKRLKELRCFYAGNFTLTLPSLKEVHIIKCSSMKSFSAVNKIHHSTEWYFAEYVSPRLESDLNSAVDRTSEEEVHILLRLNLDRE